MIVHSSLIDKLVKIVFVMVTEANLRKLLNEAK